jgi:hypothetical protein
MSAYIIEDQKCHQTLATGTELHRGKLPDLAEANDRGPKATAAVSP